MKTEDEKLAELIECKPDDIKLLKKEYKELTGKEYKKETRGRKCKGAAPTIVRSIRLTPHELEDIKSRFGTLQEFFDIAVRDSYCIK